MRRLESHLVLPVTLPVSGGSQIAVGRGIAELRELGMDGLPGPRAEDVIVGSVGRGGGVDGRGHGRRSSKECFVRATGIDRTALCYPWKIGIIKTRVSLLKMLCSHPPIYPTDERFLWRGVVEGFSNILEKEALERAKASSSPLHSSAVGIRHCHVTFPPLRPAKLLLRQNNSHQSASSAGMGGYTNHVDCSLLVMWTPSPLHNRRVWVDRESRVTVSHFNPEPVQGRSSLTQSYVHHCVKGVVWEAVSW